MWRGFLCFLVIFPTAIVQSEELSLDYSYLDLGYSRTHFSSTGILDDLDSNAVSLGAAFDVGKSTYLFADYANLTSRSDGGGLGQNDIRATALTIGAGLYTSLNDRVDLVGQVGMVRTEVEVENLFSDISSSDTGYRADAGLRGLLGDVFEYNAFARYENVNDADISLNLGGLYRPTERFGLGLNLSVGEDTTSVGLGFRFAFGKK